MFSFMMQTVWLLFTTDATFTPPFIREQADAECRGRLIRNQMETKRMIH